MASEELQQEIDDAKVEGWELQEETGENRAVMVRRGYGTLGGHTLVLLLTFWTFGFGNVCYAAYKYFVDKEKRVLRVNEAEVSTDD